MRLRRETGDFQLTSFYDAQTQAISWATIPKGLSPEDLVGTVVVSRGTDRPGYECDVITGAGHDEINGTPVIRLSSYEMGGSLIYNPATGEVYIFND